MQRLARPSDAPLRLRDITLAAGPDVPDPGALAPGQEHPLRRLLRAGARTTINSDDQGVQNSSWRDDYDFAMCEIGLTEGEIRHCLRTSFEASFLSAGEKSRYGDLKTLGETWHRYSYAEWADLTAHTLNVLAVHLRRHDRIAVVWDDALRPALHKDVVVMHWRPGPRSMRPSALSR